VLFLQHRPQAKLVVELNVSSLRLQTSLQMMPGWNLVLALYIIIRVFVGFFSYSIHFLG